jgi:hypothetical protein
LDIKYKKKKDFLMASLVRAEREEKVHLKEEKSKLYEKKFKNYAFPNEFDVRKLSKD